MPHWHVFGFLDPMRSNVARQTQTPAKEQLRTGSLLHTGYQRLCIIEVFLLLLLMGHTIFLGRNGGCQPRIPKH
jgi:hypothetical protein